MDPQVFSKKRDRLLAIYLELDSLKKEEEDLTEELQKDCAHESVVECGQGRAVAATKTDPPHRRCVICGLEEEGWDSGYEKLARPLVVNGVDRSVFLKNRRLQPLTTAPVSVCA